MAERPGASKLQSGTRAALRPLANLAWNIERVGYERLPADGPAILCPNHISFLDSAILMLTVPRNISFVGKAEYMDDWKTKTLVPALGMIPIDRAGGDAAARALDAAAGILDSGELFGIYPEGTRARDGLLHKGHTGVARLACRTGAPIIPVGILGTRAIQPPDTPVPRPFRPAEIRLGPPIHAPAETDDRMVFRQITDELMYEIRELTGQDYVDTYATKPSAPTAPVETLETTASPEMPERRSSASVLSAAAL